MFEVDFSIKINGCFQTIHKAFIDAESVSECQAHAEEERAQLAQDKDHHIRIFIEA